MRFSDSPLSVLRFRFPYSGLGLYIRLFGKINFTRAARGVTVSDEAVPDVEVRGGGEERGIGERTAVVPIKMKPALPKSVIIVLLGHPYLVVLQTSFVEFASSDAKGGHLRMPYSSSVKLTLLNY